MTMLKGKNRMRNVKVAMKRISGKTRSHMAMTPHAHGWIRLAGIKIPHDVKLTLISPNLNAVNILAQAWSEGLSTVPFGWTFVKIAPIFAVLYALKWFFNGATNGSERNMHSKVVMVTVS